MSKKRPSPEISLGTYVGVIERGEKSISVGILVHLAETLDVKASDLLRDAGL